MSGSACGVAPCCSSIACSFRCSCDADSGESVCVLNSPRLERRRRRMAAVKSLLLASVTGSVLATSVGAIGSQLQPGFDRGTVEKRARHVTLHELLRRDSLHIHLREQRRAAAQAQVRPRDHILEQLAIRKR